MYSPLLKDIFKLLEDRKTMKTSDLTSEQSNALMDLVAEVAYGRIAEVDAVVIVSDSLRAAQSAGGRKSAAAMSPEQKSERGKRAAAARWNKYHVGYLSQRSKDGAEWSNGHGSAEKHLRSTSTHETLDDAKVGAAALIGAPSPIGIALDAYIWREGKAGKRTILGEWRHGRLLRW